MLTGRGSLRHLNDLTALRAEGPVVPLRLPIIGHVRFVTHHAAASALLKDLADRGSLDSTLVLITTDFGRTPRVN